MNLVNDPHALMVMEDLQINAGHFVDILEMYYTRDEELTIPCIMQLLVENQGWRPTTVYDLCQSGAFHRWTTRNDLLVVKNDMLAGRTEIAADLMNIQKPLL